MQETVTISFTDGETNTASVALIRVVGNAVGLCLSQENNGDIEVVLPGEDCKRLISALQEATTALNG
jgi:hypothetical protein